MKTQRPAWWVLYSLLPIAGVLFGAVTRWVPAGAGSTFAEITLSLAILGGMALWVRANRIALVLGDAPEAREVPYRVRVAYQPPAARRRPLAARVSESQSQVAA